MTNDVRMFTGIEVEHNPRLGLKTLFVCGIRSTEFILAMAKQHNCNHIFFGANYSNPKFFDQDWQSMIKEVVQYYPCTMDCELTAIQSVIDLDLHCLENLHIQLRVTVPNVDKLANHRVSIKIDDVIPHTNNGVYVTPLLDHLKGFNDWSVYKQDVYIE
jgi:hypothetical protein